MLASIAIAATVVTAIVIPTAGTAQAAGCIASGTDASINAALVGVGAQAILCPGAVFNLSNSVVFTAANQAILTQGLPTDSTRATLVITGSGISTAIQGTGQNGITVENIQVNGSRPALGVLSGGGALMEMGASGLNQTVQNIYAHDTRSWSTLHFIEGAVTNNTPQCQGAQILNNQIGPAGTATPSATGVWADGISLACGTSMVSGNTITDATDGAIVVFGAPGSTIQNNTVIAKNQLLLGGINMVDYAPMNGNYTGTVVKNNTINALSAFIKMGIAQGQQAWNCATGTLYGGTVSGNTLTGQYMGYGYPVNGVTSWTVTGNIDNSRHVGTQTGGGCFGTPAASQPAGFQYEVATSSNLQAGYTSAVLTNALGTINSPTITPPTGPTLTTNPSSIAFGNQTVGTAGSAHAVTVTNSGSSAATVAAITATSGFAQTNTCGTSIAAGASCTVTVTFTPTAAGAVSGSVTVTSNATNSPSVITLSGTGTTSTTNLAIGATMTAGSSAPGYPASNANDGNASTYWESLNGSAYPQTLTAKLPAAQSLGSVTLLLPPATSWATRSQTLSVLGSTNGTSFTTLVPSTTYTFNPATGNSVSFPLPAGTNEQYLQLSFTNNTGWSAAQLSEFQIYGGSGGGGGGSATLTATPTSLAFGNQTVNTTSAAQTVTVKNTGTISATVSSISVAAPFAQSNTCGSTIAAGATCTVSVTFTPTANGAASANLTVASNATNASLAVAVTGTGTGGTTPPTNLALNAPITASSYTQTYVPANANDGNTSTYWEGVNGSWPTTMTVNLGSSKSLAKVVLFLPPAWGTRTQTLSVVGSTDNSTFSTLVGSATYTFNPATGNTVTITLPAGTTDQYVRLSFTANNVQNGGQLSEFQVWNS